MVIFRYLPSIIAVGLPMPDDKPPIKSPFVRKWRSGKVAPWWVINSLSAQCLSAETNVSVIIVRNSARKETDNCALAPWGPRTGIKLEIPNQLKKHGLSRYVLDTGDWARGHNVYVIVDSRRISWPGALQINAYELSWYVMIEKRNVKGSWASTS